MALFCAVIFTILCLLFTAGAIYECNKPYWDRPSNGDAVWLAIVSGLLAVCFFYIQYT